MVLRWKQRSRSPLRADLLPSCGQCGRHTPTPAASAFRVCLSCREPPCWTASTSQGNTHLETEPGQGVKAPLLWHDAQQGTSCSRSLHRDWPRQCWAGITVQFFTWPSHVFSTSASQVLIPVKTSCTSDFICFWTIPPVATLHII